MSASIWFVSSQAFSLCILRWKSIAPLNRWNLPFKNCNCLCLGSLTRGLCAKRSFARMQIRRKWYHVSMGHMHNHCVFREVWNERWRGHWSVSRLYAHYIKIYVLSWCHARYVFSPTITCRNTVQCGIVTSLKDSWRSNNLHKIFFVYKYTWTSLIFIYFRHFSTETLTFKEMIFLILCWMTERYFDESWHSLKVRVFSRRA